MATIATPAARPKEGYFAYLPIGFFGSAMGLTGLAGAWHEAHFLFGVPLWIAMVLGYAAILDFCALAICYAVKVATSFDSVRTEFVHPIAGNLFAAPLVGLLLLPALLVGFSIPLARTAWAVGAVLMTMFAWLVVTRWMSVRQQVGHVTPEWVVPVVAMIDIPLSVPSLQLESIQGFMMFAVSVGLFFTIPLFTVIFSRLLFGEPTPDALQPSLLIILAPFAVGFLSYTTTTGHIDAFAQALYMVTLFLLAVLLPRLRHLPRCCPFRVSWWSVAFPLAASASATVRYAGFASHPVTDAIATAVLAVATVSILSLLVLTLRGIARGDLRALSH
jgi:tellurite resistance protein